MAKKVYVKRIRRICGFRGCNHTMDVYAMGATSQLGGGMIACEECLHNAIIAIKQYKIDESNKLPRAYNPPPPLFGNVPVLTVVPIPTTVSVPVPVPLGNWVGEEQVIPVSINASINGQDLKPGVSGEGIAVFDGVIPEPTNDCIQSGGQEVKPHITGPAISNVSSPNVTSGFECEFCGKVYEKASSLRGHNIKCRG